MAVEQGTTSGQDWCGARLAPEKMMRTATRFHAALNGTSAVIGVPVNVKHKDVVADGAAAPVIPHVTCHGLRVSGASCRAFRRPDRKRAVDARARRLDLQTERAYAVAVDNGLVGRRGACPALHLGPSHRLARARALDTSLVAVALLCQLRSRGALPTSWRSDSCCWRRARSSASSSSERGLAATNRQLASAAMAHSVNFVIRVAVRLVRVLLFRIVRRVLGIFV